jgi:hypothetical protein
MMACICLDNRGASGVEAAKWHTYFGMNMQACGPASLVYMHAHYHYLPLPKLDGSLLQHTLTDRRGT